MAKNGLAIFGLAKVGLNRVDPPPPPLPKKCQSQGGAADKNEGREGKLSRLACVICVSSESERHCSLVLLWDRSVKFLFCVVPLWEHSMKLVHGCEQSAHARSHHCANPLHSHT